MCNLTLDETMCKMIELSNSKRDKAILLLLWSSGMQPRFIRKLTIRQLISACNHLFHEDEDKTIECLINRRRIHNDSIACFDIGGENNHRVTCCTPEALGLIFNHVYWSIKQDKLGKYVFLNNNGGKLTTNHVSDLIIRLRNQIYDYGDFNTPDINAKIIRERFNTIIDNQLRGPCPELAIRLMKGDKTQQTRNFYNRVLNDRKILTTHYMTVLNELSLTNIENQRKANSGIEYTVNRM